MTRGGVVHWDEAERRRVEQGPIRVTWRELGRLAGTEAVGLRYAELGPGDRPTPAHDHGAEEEIFYVLSGSGLSWQSGATYEVRPGDCLVHLPGAGAHTLVAGDEGLVALAFGERRATEACHLPRAGVLWLGPSWVADAEEGGTPYAREVEAGELPLPPPSPRPTTIVNLADVAAVERRRARTWGSVRDLGRAAGSVTTGLRHVVISPGHEAAPPHCHSSEEELFVVLDGSGVCQLGDDEHAVRAGSVVARPAGTRVAHSFRADEGGLTLLAYGQRIHDDVCYYPRSGKVFLRGVGVIFRPEQLDYWDGEE